MSLFGVWIHKKGSIIIIIILDMIIIIVTITFIINYMGSKNWQERDTVHGAGVSQRTTPSGTKRRMTTSGGSRRARTRGT